MTDISERTFPLDDELVPLIQSAGGEGGIVVLPEFVEEIDGTLVASFVDSTQELRVELAELGVDVRLALPEGGEPRPYEQHFVEWVLPLIFAVPGAVASTAQIVAWLRSRKAKSGAEIMRYREARLEQAEGRYLVRELVGPSDQVADAIERFGLGQSSGDPTKELSPGTGTNQPEFRGPCVLKIPPRA
jgi:hypothetical protein